MLSVAKKDIPEVNAKAIKEMYDKYFLNYFDYMTFSKEELNEQCTSSYMKTLIDDFIRSEYNSENEYCYEVSIMDACKNYGISRQKSKIDRYAKVITIMHIINSREPGFYHKLMSEWHYPPLKCYHPISVADVIRNLGNVLVKYIANDGVVYETVVVTFAQALLKDIFDDTSRCLAAMIHSGEFDIFDDMMIRRENFYIPVSQYILIDEIDKVTLYACEPD